MLDSSAVGLSVEQSFTYTWRDVILYNLAVGAKQEELQYVYEDGLKAVPTFGVLPCTATFNTEPYHSMPYMPTELIPDLRTDGTVHMEHSLELYKPIPIGAKLRSEKTISAVYDRGPGKGAQIVVDILVYDELGEKLCLNKMSYLNRWYDSFGGEKQPKTPNPVPEREPDMVLDGSFPENAALLYRLTGDTYPMHASPEIARSVGFPKPLLHGLCSLGNACRMLTGALCGGNSEAVRGITVRFAGVTYPGDSFKLMIWKLGDGSAAYRMVNAESGQIILDRGTFSWA